MNDLVVGNIKSDTLSRLIAANHYSKRCSSISLGFGVWQRDVLVGGIVFSAGVGRFANAYCRVCKPTEVVELTRLWLADACPRNSESKVIAVAIRAIRKKPGRFKAILSYADELAGHVGTIYQATNFYYMGQSGGGTSSNIRIGDQVFNSRSLNSRFGTHSIEKLKSILKRQDISYYDAAGGTVKHAYVYPLTDDARRYCEANRKPYPTRAKQAMAGNPPAQRHGSGDPHAPSMTVQRD